MEFLEKLFLRFTDLQYKDAKGFPKLLSCEKWGNKAQSIYGPTFDNLKKRFV